MTLGSYARDKVTGVAGKIVAVMTHYRDAAQLKLQRYGVDGYGKPFEPIWVYMDDCIPCDEEAAKV